MHSAEKTLRDAAEKAGLKIKARCVCPACHWEFNPEAKVDRSNPMHRRYFAMVAAAFKQWPESYEYQPLDAEALRTFLQMRAGCEDTITSKKTGDVFLIPRSVSFKKMPQSTFNQLNERVERLIYEIVGVSGDDLLHQNNKGA